MNHSDTPIGGSEKKNYIEMAVKEVSNESLAAKWADFLGAEYGEQFCEVITFDTSATNEKEKNGIENKGLNGALQNVDANAIKIVRPDVFVKAAKFGSKTKKNAKVYDRERAIAKEQTEARRDMANHKVETEMKSVNRRENEAR